MKVALVHDYLLQYGGAERVLEVLHETFPDAPIYTSIYDKKNFENSPIRDAKVFVSFMQYLPFIFNNFRAYFMLYPYAFGSFNLDEYDLIISSSSAYAKGIKKRKDAKHICYCHNPMRFVWQFEEYTKKERFPAFFKFIIKYLLWPIQKWDIETSKNVDLFIANSGVVQERIKSIYNRNSVIIYPSIDTDKYNISEANGDYFLVVSRLLPYKRIDIAVDALSKLNLPLKIVGAGPAEDELRKNAGKNIGILGKVSDPELVKLYAQCRALIVCGMEDFGMAPLEAAASGRPTIAFKAGGVLETIIDGVTGLFYDEQSVEALIGAIKRFETVQFDKIAIKNHAQKFSKEVFKDRIRSFLHENKIL